MTAGSLAASGKTASESDCTSRMHLYCNQLEEHFSFQNRELTVHPPPLVLRKKTNVGLMKFGDEYNQPFQSCQG